MSASQRTPARSVRHRLRERGVLDCRNMLVALRLELLRHAHEVPTTRTELRRKHADATAVADFVDVIEQVDDIKPYRNRLVSGHGDLSRHPDIDLTIRRHVVEIAVTGPEPAAVDHVSTETRPVPEIRNTGRSCPSLGMIGENPVVRDVGNFGSAEQKLVGDDVRSPLHAPRQVAVSTEVAVLQPDGALYTVVLSLLVVEGGQHIGRAELAVV